jgi:alpha-L-rhamnosidase
MALGIYPTADGYKTVRIKPAVKDFDTDWARGSVNTPYGNLLVDWSVTDGVFTLEVDLPSDEMHAEIILPDGKTFETVSKKAKFQCKI